MSKATFMIVALALCASSTSACWAGGTTTAPFCIGNQCCHGCGDQTCYSYNPPKSRKLTKTVKTDMPKKVTSSLSLKGVMMAEFTPAVQDKLEKRLAKFYGTCPTCVEITNVTAATARGRRLAAGSGITFGVVIYTEDDTAVKNKSNTVTEAMVKTAIADSFLDAGVTAPATIDADVPTAGFGSSMQTEANQELLRKNLRSPAARALTTDGSQKDDAGSASRRLNGCDTVCSAAKAGAYANCSIHCESVQCLCYISAAKAYSACTLACHHSGKL